MFVTLNASMTIRTYSPLTLGHEWSKASRLLFMVGLSTLGTIMNGFFVAAFFVESTLRKSENVFHACTGLSDLIITTGVIPTSAVVLLSGQWDIEPVCYALHFLAVSSTYCYNLFFMLVAAENYYRICRKKKEYKLFKSKYVGMLSVLVFVVGFIAAGVGVYLEYDYDYCKRSHFGNFYFRAATAVILEGVPFVITMFGFISASVQVRHRARKKVQYKRSHVFEFDNSTTALNITTYILFVIAWMPYLIIVHEFPRSSDTYFYHCVWLGLSRSVLSSFLYAFLNRNFRRAFAHLFDYCCCKNALSSSFSSRHRRALEYRYTTGDIRVHIMHQALNVGSPRYSSSSRETQEL